MIVNLEEYRRNKDLKSLCTEYSDDWYVWQKHINQAYEWATEKIRMAKLTPRFSLIRPKHTRDEHEALFIGPNDVTLYVSTAHGKLTCKKALNMRSIIRWDPRLYVELIRNGVVWFLKENPEYQVHKQKSWL